MCRILKQETYLGLRMCVCTGISTAGPVLFKTPCLTLPRSNIRQEGGRKVNSDFYYTNPCLLRIRPKQSVKKDIFYTISVLYFRWESKNSHVTSIDIRVTIYRLEILKQKKFY